MSTPEAKIVDMTGKPIDPVGETHPKIIEALKWVQVEIAGETHVAIGIVLVDAMGRVGTHHFWKAGFAHQAISGAAVLQSRMVKNYENLCSAAGSDADGAA